MSAVSLAKEEVKENNFSNIPASKSLNQESKTVNTNLIKEIQIFGLKNVSRGTVLNYLPLEVGDVFLESKIEEIAKSFRTTGFFQEAQVSFKDSILTITIKENPTIKIFEIKTEDDKVLTEEIIHELEKNFGVGPGNIFTTSSFNQLKKQISSIYFNNGYYGLNIKESIDIDEQNRVNLTLEIEKGNKALIKSFTISGAKSFSEEELLDLFDIGEPDIFLLNYFTEKDHFSKFIYDAGVEKLTKKYLDSGYLDFKIIKNNVSLNEENGNIQIHIDISEGELYKLNSLSFSGDTFDLPEGFFKDLFPLKTGDILVRKKIVEGIEAISSHYSDIGYAYSKVTSKVGELLSGNKVDLVINIESGKKYSINRIIITGNTRTQDDVIRRQLGINESELYSKSEIDRSINKIKRLGYFSKVKNELKNIDIDKIDLYIEVEETKTGEFSVGLAHSGSTGAAFNLGISQNNILGTGNTLKAKLSNSAAVSERSFYFLNPSFNKNGHSISYGAISKKLDAANLDVNSYQLNEIGFNLGYGVPLDYDSNFFGEISVSDIDLRCGVILSSDSYEPSQCLSNDKNDVTLSFNYKQNDTNSSIFPTAGSSNTAKFTLALPIADYKYFSSNFGHRSYIPISDTGFTFKQGIKLNLAKGYDNKDLPFFKRFFAGGSSSIRGFDFNSIGEKYPNGLPKGGEALFEGNFSIITPANFIISNENQRFAAFIDYGSVSTKFSNFKFDDMRASAGVAFSWFTPIGPIGIFAAKPLIKKSNDSIESFAFQLGTSF